MSRVSLIVVVVCVVLAPLALAGPDLVELDVSDLVLERAGTTGRPVGWRVHVSNAMEPGRLIVGEANLLCGLDDPQGRPELPDDPGVGSLPPLPAVVEDEALVAALAAASEVPTTSFRLDEGLLRVRAEDAAAVRSALAALRKAGPPDVQLDARLEAVDADGASETLFAASGHVTSGLPSVFADAVMTNVLTDYEVEIAQACVIANPVVQVRRTGASLLTRVHPLPSGDHALVEAVLRVAEPLPRMPIDLGHPGFGPLDRCRTRFEEAAVTFLVENGKPTVQLWTGRRQRQMRFTVTVGWTKAARGERLLWSNLLANPIAGFRNLRGGTLGNWFEERDTETPVRRGLQSRLASEEARRSLGARMLEIDVLLVPAGAPVSPGKPQPEGAAEVARVRARVLEGLPACFNGSEEQLYLVDWDVEVAQAARVPDPVVHEVQDGHFLEATLLGHGEASRVRLDLELLRLAGLERRVMPLDVAQSSAGVQGNIFSSTSSGGQRHTGSIVTGPSMPQNTVAIEQPSVHSLRITSSIPLGSDGVGMLRRSARGFTGKAKDLVVVVRCPAR